MNKNQLVFVAIALLGLVGLFFLFKPKTEVQTPTPQTTTEQTATPSSIQQSNVKTFELVVKNKKLVSGPKTIKVNQGDEMTIKITSDEAEELHIHAYDNGVELKPGKQTTLTFTTSLSGRFPFELENSKTEIGVLEVQPK